MCELELEAYAGATSWSHELEPRAGGASWSHELEVRAGAWRMLARAVSWSWS